MQWTTQFRSIISGMFPPRLIFANASGFLCLLVPFTAIDTCFAQQAIAPRPVIVGPAPVFFAGPGVVAPELVPKELPIEEISPCVKVNGTTVLSATVDKYGRPNSASILKSAGPGLDLEALSILKSDRFKPGMHDGLQADIAVEVVVEIHGCMYGKKTSNGWMNVMSLLSSPEQSVTVRQQLEQAGSDKRPTNADGGIAPHSAPEPSFGPKLLNKVLPRYPTDVREANITGECLVRVTVDEKGIPHDPQLVRGIVPSLDQEAIKAVMQYRFSPAIRLRDGQPASATFVSIVEFKLD